MNSWHLYILLSVSMPSKLAPTFSPLFYANVILTCGNKFKCKKSVLNRKYMECQSYICSCLCYKMTISCHNSRWLRLLFTREFSMSDVLRLWDGLFACDPSLDLARWICVAMLIRIRNERTFPAPSHINYSP